MGNTHLSADCSSPGQDRLLQRRFKLFKISEYFSNMKTFIQKSYMFFLKQELISDHLIVRTGIIDEIFYLPVRYVQSAQSINKEIYTLDHKSVLGYEFIVCCHIKMLY